MAIIRIKKNLHGTRRTITRLSCGHTDRWVATMVESMRPGPEPDPHTIGAFASVAFLPAHHTYLPRVLGRMYPRSSWWTGRQFVQSHAHRAWPLGARSDIHAVHSPC